MAKPKIIQDILNVTPIYGTWTPRISGSTVEGVNTYGQQIGSYVKIGKFVHAEYIVAMTAKDAAMAGSTLIKGLPFPVASTSAAVIGSTFGISLPAEYQNQLNSIISGTAITLVGFSNGSSDNIPVANVSASNQIIGSVDYIASA